MYYWNKANFEGLARLAELLREDSRCMSFADYCELRATGIRKKAFKSLREFLAVFQAWTSQEKRDWANGLMEMHLVHQEVHQLISHPLKEALILVFEEWAGQDAVSPSPCRWLGVLTCDVNWFKEALGRDPEDEYSRWRVVDELIDFAEFACHHIPEYFIGSPSDAIQALDEAEAILEPIRETRRGCVAFEELKKARQKLDDWIDFQSSGTTNFDEWCKRERGYNWNLPTVVYYKKN